MLGLPADGVSLFVGVALLSTALAGTAVQLGPSTPTGAERAADTIDAVAADGAPAVGVYPLAAESVTVAPTAVSVTADGTTQSASLQYGPVAPVDPGTTLAAVLAGQPPQQAYENVSAFETALDTTDRSTQQYTRPGQIRVRTLTWGDIDVTLAGR